MINQGGGDFYKKNKILDCQDSLEKYQKEKPDLF